MSEMLKRTPLYDAHVAAGARIVPFAGYEMPVQYSGIVDEHLAVRRAAGLFDVSHMGEILIQGPNAKAFVQNLVSNDVEKLYDNKAMYSVMCNEHGGIIDDLLVYRRGEEDYLLVVNASNREKDFNWMLAHNEVGAEITDVSDDMALLAIQGPRSFEIVERLLGRSLTDLPYYHILEAPPGVINGFGHIIFSHTGYTGERGLELYCRTDDAMLLWEMLMEVGRHVGLKPAGLGARDTLRLEAGFCLYGNDLSEDTNPLEAGLGWITKLDKGPFIGSEALREIKAAGVQRKLIGFVLEERGIPRHDYRLLNEAGEVIGSVTSGTQSPILERGIGMGYVTADSAYTTPGAAIAVEIRGKAVRATVRKPPFHKN